MLDLGGYPHLEGAAVIQQQTRVAQDWGSLIAEGVLAVLFGLVLLFAPVATLAALVLLFGLFAIADGLVMLAGMFVSKRHTPRWALALYGIASIALGALVLAWPGLTLVTLAALVAIWAIVIGVLRILAAFLVDRGERNWSMALGGAVAILLGLYLLVIPAALRLLVVAIGIYALVKGVLLIMAGIRGRRGGRPGGLGERPLRGPGEPSERDRPEDRREAA